MHGAGVSDGGPDGGVGEGKRLMVFIRSMSRASSASIVGKRNIEGGVDGCGGALGGAMGIDGGGGALLGAGGTAARVGSPKGRG